MKRRCKRWSTPANLAKLPNGFFDAYDAMNHADIDGDGVVDGMEISLDPTNSCA